MGLFDIFTEELPNSWDEPEVKKWKEKAKISLTTYSNAFEGTVLFEYSVPEESKLLIANICFAMFGPPMMEANELWNAYPEEQQKSAEEILEKIMEAYEALSCTRLYVGMIKIACKQGEAEYDLPLFTVFSDKEAPEKNAACAKYFIDSQKRIYKSWDDWKENNVLPMLKYAYPKYGFFSCSNDCTYSFDKTKELAIEFATSPACNITSRIFRGTDAVSIVTTLGCGAIAITSMFTPVGPALLFGSAITGTSFGVYGTVRSAGRLIDKGTHAESLSDFESFAIYLGMLILPLHVGSSIVTNQLVTGATANGRIFSSSFRTFATILNFTTLGVDSLMLGCGLFNLIEKYQKDQLTSLDLVQFSMSVFFFSHTLIQPKTAMAIIERAQDTHMQQYASRMTDEEVRAVFDKFKNDNLGAGGIQEKSKIIRTINRIPEPNDVFGRSDLKEAASIKIGGRKGRSLLVSENVTTQKRIPAQTRAQTRLVNPINVQAQFDQAITDIEIDAENFEVNGEKIFANLDNAKKARVKTVLGSVSKKNGAIIREAFDLAGKLSDLKQCSTLDKCLSLIEILANEYHQREDTSVSLSTFLTDKAKSPFFLEQIRADIQTADRLIGASNVSFADAFKTVTHCRKHGVEFPAVQQALNSEQKLTVYSKDIPQSLMTDASLREIVTVSDDCTKFHFVDQNDKFLVVVKRTGNDQATICTVFTKKNAYQNLTNQMDTITVPGTATKQISLSTGQQVGQTVVNFQEVMPQQYIDLRNLLNKQ